ncbi:hypothetical protein JNW91_18425 [Micromonospora sp. STR1_7]|uniref:Glycosyl transferase n=1 Tax=Micromonospora parastrephiae TaxID=2806101 RepID=A0ABS1XWM0_9ACTN|nr:hypothetical protein [Micromonospora parastrephiae]MBM0233659.1 hypothetical protein [Micromonospora parastrephiae]
MSSAAPTAPDAAPEQALRLADQVNRQPWAVRLLTAVRRRRGDLSVALLFVVLAGWLTHGLWPDPGGRTLALNPEDQALYEWFLAVDARALLGDFSLLTDRLNAPDGVNLMANTTVIALGVVCAPVTLLLGAPVTFALLAAANLAGTALAWYLLFHRTLGARRLAAALGGGLCGFGPGMVSQTNSHLHMTAQWLVPVIVWLVVRLMRASDPGPTGSGPMRPAAPDRRRMLSSAAGLAAAVIVQVFVGEEVLFLAAIALFAMAVSYAVMDRDLARRALPNFTAGLAVAAGLALLVLGYPLWFQFDGPQGVADGMFSPAYFSADLSSWWTVSPLSILGRDESARLTTGPAEYNTFLGWPLLLAAVASAIWTGRRRLVLACVVAGLVMVALSLGPEVVLGGTRTALPGPYALLAGLPVVDGALPMRFGLALLPIIATLLVLAVDRALGSTGRVRRFVPLAVIAALLPIFPTPLPTAGRPAVPEFITGGHWRQCVRPGGVLVPVPLPTPKEPWPMRWAAAADADFGLPEGFFIGPYGRGGTAAMGTFKQPTSALLADVARRGDQPAIGDEQRRQAARDVDFWGASCVALADGAPHAESLRATLEQLYGPSTRVADAWIWRV